jgi:hypothetical protein
VKERPILFSAPMVRAILDDSKTQTRRIVKGVPMWGAEHDAQWHPHVLPPDSPGGEFSWWEGPAHGPSNYFWARCPYGEPGERLWVRETWMRQERQILYRADLDDCGQCLAYGIASGCPSSTQLRVTPKETWIPSIHMYRAYSRITLEVTDVRVQRLQAIGELDALAEGIPPNPFREESEPVELGCAKDFADLWEQIHGPGSWDLNPWVWCVSFKRVAAAGCQGEEE